MLKISLLLCLIIASVSCATTPPQHSTLEQRIHAEPQANSPDEIAQRAADVFSSAPGLTDDQRKRLHALYLKTYNESRNIRKDIGQMKSLLFKEAAYKRFNSKDMAELTRRIVEADQKRLNLMFAAFQEMQNIIGYGEDKKDIYDRLRDYDYPGNAHR
ncbi:hypothetical protein DOM22_05130 [Bdellovibrio sp. ZAP7]|uniref:hypothetical protein n=1 Tax=Bdellovibrio sp. ZAP7 TaxID=2231053 RepID=UPI00115AE3AC|nr:hypothetical protein [Bdellovibrio sp. ZAP7]QDK44584.1 hypothetical protein DOM22_05130 [Bdellovibrio sp. ZAP7]